MKNVNVGDAVLVDDLQSEFIVKDISDDSVTIANNYIELKCNMAYAISNYVKKPRFKANEQVRLKHDYPSRYFTCYEQLEIMFMDLEQQDCIIKSLRGIYEQVPIDMLLKWAEDPYPTPLTPTQIV